MANRTNELISRATAFAVGLALAIACARLVVGIRTSVAEADEVQRTSGYRPKATVPAALILGVVATGGASLLLIGFAIVPTRWLHSLDPSHSKMDGDDLRGVLRRGPW